MRSRGLTSLLLVVLTGLVFLPVRAFDFVDFDDYDYVVENPLLRSEPGAAGVWRAFAEPYHDNWAPLFSLSLQLDHRLFGLDAGGYHLTNLLLHLASTVLLFLALARMTGAHGRSAFVAAVFAVHPLHVESVAWISERKDTLSGLFFALTLLAYARYAERPEAAGRYGVVLLCLALGLLAKPMLVTLPCVLLLLDFWPLGRLSRRAFVEKLPMFAMVAVVSAVTWIVQRGAGLTSLGASLGLDVRLLNAFESYALYLADFFWPTGLAVFYPHPGAAVSTGWALGAAALLAAISLGVTFRARSRPYLAVGWLWFLGMLVPVIGLVQVGMQARADRYLYLPQIGLAIAVAWGAVDLTARWRARGPVLAAAAVACIAALGIAASKQLIHWKNSAALFERALAVTEGNFKAHHGLANARLREGRLDDAQAHFAEAARLAPGWREPRLGLVDVLAQRGELGAALGRVERELRDEPDDPLTAAKYGLLLLRVGRFTESREPLERALAEFPASATLHAGVAVVYAASDRADAAARHGREALRLDPALDGAANNLAWLLATCSDPAVRDPGEALELAEALAGPGHEADANRLDTLAAAQAASGHFEDAAANATRAAELATRRGSAAQASEIRERVVLYRLGQPFIESPSPR